MPGVGETITWARALLALGPRRRPRRDARRRAEGARGHRARAREGRCSTVPERGRWRHRALQELAAALRARGVRVGVGELLAAHRALAAVDAGSREEAFHALRADAVLVARRPRAVRAAFVAVFGAGRPPRGGARRRARRARRARRCRASRCRRRRRSGARRAARRRPRRLERGGAAARARTSPRTPTPSAPPRGGCSRGCAARGPTRAEPAHAPGRHRGHLPDLRATTRASLRQGGELLERRWRAPTPAPAPARARARRLRLDGAVRAHAAPVRAGERRRARARRGVRVRHAAHAAHARAGRPRPRPARCSAPPSASTDWSGGTRIGAVAGRRSTASTAAGSAAARSSSSCPTAGTAATPTSSPPSSARLRRTAHRLVWLNPLAADPRYEPLTRGMRAAMPHVDRLLPGNTIASLEQLADLMEGQLA